MDKPYRLFPGPKGGAPAPTVINTLLVVLCLLLSPAQAEDVPTKEELFRNVYERYQDEVGSEVQEMSEKALDPSLLELACPEDGCPTSDDLAEEVRAYGDQREACAADPSHCRDLLDVAAWNMKRDGEVEAEETGARAFIERTEENRQQTLTELRADGVIESAITLRGGTVREQVEDSGILDAYYTDCETVSFEHNPVWDFRTCDEWSQLHLETCEDTLEVIWKKLPGCIPTQDDDCLVPVGKWNKTCGYLYAQHDLHECEFTTGTCLDDEPCKVIGGEEVCLDYLGYSCWQYANEFTCRPPLDSIEGYITTQNCQPLEQHPLCQQPRAACVSSWSDRCTWQSTDYWCPVTNGFGHGYTNCANQRYCIGGVCYDSGDYSAETDYYRALSQLTAIGSASAGYSIGRGIAEGEPASCGLYQRPARPDLQDCCGTHATEGQGVDAECSDEDRDTAEAVLNRRCHLVGSTCAVMNDWLGVCLEKRQVYCCFETPPQRYLQEDVRKQVGRSFGSPDSPDCGALTVEEIQGANFDRMYWPQHYEDTHTETTPEEWGDNAGLPAEVRPCLTDPNCQEARNE